MPIVQKVPKMVEVPQASGFGFMVSGSVASKGVAVGLRVQTLNPKPELRVLA